MSRWELINAEISRIQFHTDFDRKTKNKMISKLERILEKAENAELKANEKGKSTGFYND